MRIASVSLAVGLAACAVERPATTMRVSPAPPPALRGDDALALIEASPTLDGPPVGANPGGGTLLVVFASWCEHCRDQLAMIDQLRATHPALRVLGVNWRRHEEYGQLGSADAVRAYVARHAPWLIVVPADDRVFEALGRPPKVPTMFLYDRAGRLAWTYDRRLRPPPTASELEAELARVGT
jgi:thiol-disulfide isomerase/thioredoxin